MSPSRPPLCRQWGVCVTGVSGVCDEWCVAVGVSAWAPSGGEGLSLMPLPFLSRPTGICPSGGPLPSSAGRKRLLPVPLRSFASISASPHLPRPGGHAFSPRWLCSRLLLGPAHPGPLTCMCPRCSGCSVWHAPPALLPAGPTPSRSCAGGLGGRGILNPQGGGGQGTESPVSCFY